MPQLYHNYGHPLRSLYDEDSVLEIRAKLFKVTEGASSVVGLQEWGTQTINQPPPDGEVTFNAPEYDYAYCEM
jgi:hypothetical protein